MSFHYGAKLASTYLSPEVAQTSPLPQTPQHAGLEDSLLSGLAKLPTSSSAFAKNSRLHAILLRYFIEEVARRFDLCDPENHFARVVPQRASESPPLLNAIFTISARLLYRLPKHRNSSGVVEWQGIMLPNITEESAVYFHNECIRDLLKLSMDPQQVHNQNLLVAAIILRTDEEMDAPLRDNEGDKEVFLRMLSIFLDAQVPSAPALSHTSPRIHHSPSSIHGGPDPSLNSIAQSRSLLLGPGEVEVLTPNHSDSSLALHTDGLRQASFWVALRQELFTAFIRQRPLTFPLAYYEPFRNFSPADDAVWADRLVIFCADVFQYCFGASERAAPKDTERWRWDTLQSYGRDLRAFLPNSFEPTYYRPPLVQNGEVFPEIWYLDDCHVTGIVHAELARILLLTFDPTRPKVGPGCAASAKELVTQLRASILRLCGIASNNRGSPSVFLYALMGIATCGEYLEESREQEAVLELLVMIKHEHTYFTDNVADTLKRAWGRG